tara:strand:- start:44 stop:289 length:246 start_codon:yes stop_codon:yes gene_type:complete
MKAYDSAFDLIGDPVESKLLQEKNTLMNSILDNIMTLEINQIDAAFIMGVTQPRVSDLYQGKISKFTMDILFKMNERIKAI